MGARLYKVDPAYLKHLHSIDNRISVKYNNRPVVVLTVKINNYIYAVPLTSQTTSERIKDGKNKRSNVTTTFIKDSSGKEIANLLHNNMFPVLLSCLTELKLDPHTDSYEIMEQRYIRKNIHDINSKSQNVYNIKYNPSHPSYRFINRLSCEFKKLEKGCDVWKVSH